MSDPLLFPIVRTDLKKVYVTPSGSTTDLFVNCANKNNSSWLWKYYWVKTRGLNPTIQGYAGPDSTNSEEMASGFILSDPFIVDIKYGYTFTRGMFAYVATNSVPFSCILRGFSNPSTGTAQASIALVCRLHNLSGALLTTYANTMSPVNTGEGNDGVYEIEFTGQLPPTTEPKVLWAGVYIIPSGSGVDDWRSVFNQTDIEFSFSGP